MKRSLLTLYPTYTSADNYDTCRSLLLCASLRLGLSSYTSRSLFIYVALFSYMYVSFHIYRSLLTLYLTQTGAGNHYAEIQVRLFAFHIQGSEDAKDALTRRSFSAN